MTKKRIACVTLPVLVLGAVGLLVWLPGFVLMMTLRGVAAAIGWLAGAQITPPSRQLMGHE
jgi:hypothetical protein